MYDFPRMKFDTLQVKFTRLQEIGMFQKHCVHKVKLNVLQKFDMSQERLARFEELCGLQKSGLCQARVVVIQTLAVPLEFEVPQ